MSARLGAAVVVFGLLGFPSVEASDETDPEQEIRVLRAQGRFQDALPLARDRLARRRAERAPAWEIEAAERLTRLLDRISRLPVEEQERLAEADRLRLQHREAYRADDGERCLELAAKELEIRETILGPEDLDVAETLCDLGLYHDWFWTDLDVGTKRYRRCLAIRRRELNAPHPDLATAVQRLGTQLRRLDEWGEAESMLREALAMQREMFGEQHPDTAMTMHHLAILLVRFGAYDEARELYEKALAFHREHLTYADVLLPENMIALGNVYRDLGLLEKAEPLYREALALTRQRVGEDAWYVSWAQVYVATVLLYQGRYDEADEMMLEADRRLRRIDPLHRQLFQIVDLRGRIAFERGDYAAAEKLLAEALEHDRRLRGTDANYHVVLALQRLGMARYHLGDIEGAEALLTEALAGFEEARLRVGAGLSRSRFASTPYVPLAVLRLERGRTVEAWQAVERARGRALADLVAPDASTAGAMEVFSLDRIQRSLDDGTAIAGWLDYHLYSGEPRFWGYVIRNSGPVQWVRLGDLGVGAQRQKRKPDAQVRRSDPDLSLPYELRDRLEAFRDRLAPPDLPAFAPMSRDDSLEAESHALWKERFAPLEAHLRGVERLVLVPSWAMNGFPIGILRAEDGTWLEDRYVISYAPSATVYALLAERAERRGPRRRNGLLVGDPPFREEHLAAMQKGRSPLPPGIGRTETDSGATRSILRGVVAGDRGAASRLPRLFSSRAEVESIAGLLHTPLVLLGESASERQLSRLAAADTLREYDVVHLATHAVVDESRPERSALILAQAGADAATEDDGEAADGFLTAEEIAASWRLNAELVTLSACETGLGENLFGEGIVGFAYPFLRAGAGSLLVSLWEVDDEATTLLMQRFYSEWTGSGSTGGVSRARALRRAARRVREYTDAEGRQPFQHPYYWSGFVLIGDPG